MPYLKVNDVRYYYELSGRGQPLLLLHGFTGSLETWQTHAEAFADQYMTITIDLLGHGRTEAPADAQRYHMENSGEDIAAVLRAVGSLPVNLLGYSMGGRLALYLALTHSTLVDRLILESASPGLESETDRHARIANDAQLADTIERDGLEAFVNKWEQIPLFGSQMWLPTAVKNHLRRQRLRNRTAGLANSLRGMGTGIQPSLWPRLHELKMPVLLLAGELDRKFCELAMRMAAVVPQARVEIVPGAGHTIHLEQPLKFSEIILRFLEEVQTGTCLRKQ
jgi:2-succinyl-6-hydroxy-2,4-cyclohexadiene-1-carboxylate synthase